MPIEDRIYRLIRLLLYVAKEENTEVTPTKLQKIFFLLEEEEGEQLGLEFIPGFFGPYSPELHVYIYKLIELREIEEEEVTDPLSGKVIARKWHYVLKTEFTPSNDEKEKQIEAFFREWVKKDCSDILNYVYKKYPEYGPFQKVGDLIMAWLKLNR